MILFVSGEGATDLGKREWDERHGQEKAQKRVEHLVSPICSQSAKGVERFADMVGSKQKNVTVRASSELGELPGLF